MQGIDRHCLPLQGYLKALLAACNKTEATGPLDGPVSGSKPSATARVGVKCLAILLKSLAHFNHAFDILQVRAARKPLPFCSSICLQVWQ